MNTLVVVIALAVLRVDEWQIGLLHWVAVPLWAQSVITIILFGLPVVGYFLYRIITPFLSYLTHANIRLPLWLDRP